MLKEHLHNAQHRMKVQLDKKTSEREFAVGDLVFVKLRPYKQMSLRPYSVHKLMPRFFRPFKVSQRIGMVAYRLKLQKGTRIHPVFHVSQLKEKTRPSSCTPYLPTTLTTHGNVIMEPEAILD
ncbi:UNVERIFIED_CONTAM: hypothetical protein Slati_2643300 [Sesamum latifolium]|uniref:Tf2-1-like SH3-like domain-containing protein n=1 Tax=Sesamum latifolium TaxID=2727402 RepID=A0AAW2VUH2_9LAMI